MLVGAAIGAGIGAAGYTASVALSDGGFNNWNWGSFGKAVGMGALSGAITAGIGQGFGDIGKFGHELLRAGAHGVSGGLTNLAFGGDFLEGFTSAALGSLAGSGFQAWGGNFAKSAVGTISFSSVAGGVGAELTGGDFWRGAATGAIVAGLNHVAHRALDGDGPKPKPKKETTTIDKVDEVSTGLGVYADTKESLLKLAQKTGELGKAGEFLQKSTKWLGRASGITQLGVAGLELHQSGYKSYGAWVKFGVTALTLRANPYVAIGIGVLDAAGGTKWFYNQVDNYTR